MQPAILRGASIMIAFAICQSMAAAQKLSPTPQTYRTLADEAESQLRRNVLDVWFPRCVDPAPGGFHSAFARDWTRRPGGDVLIVFQARMTWITATVAMRRPDLRDQYTKYARHGLAYLRDVMWDAQDGGAFWELTADGQPKADGQKHLYGLAFAIYAPAAVYEALGDKDALDLSLRTFRWLDQHAHDASNGGYYESLRRDGTPFGADALAAQGPAMFPDGAFPIGYKTMNAHIHLLEALTELYRASKDPTVGRRLDEVLAVVRDKIAVEPGCLNQFFTADWRAVPDFDSFGHDIETAFLMVEASEALGRPDDQRTWQMARRLVDHALAWGFDERYGGFYDKGAAFDAAHDRRKTWWVQFEGLNALLLIHARFGHQSPRYFDAFVKTWRFVTEHMADPKFGGFYAEVEQDGTVTNTGKAQNWKAAYHDGRALLNIADRLRRLAGNADAAPTRQGTR